MNIFEITEMAGIVLNNRVLRAATDEGMADQDGNPTQKILKLYEKLCFGGIGGIITGYMAVSDDGVSTIPGMIMIDSDKRIPGLAEVVSRVHEMKTPIICQVAHCGRNGVAGKAFNVNRISEDTINRVINDFVQAACRAYKAGFDGVELHLAHGYFLSEMLSPHTNKRKDQWGGTTENRMRIVKEIICKIRKELPEFPILAKVNGEERYKKGIHPEEAAKICKLMEACGLDAIEVSCGIDWTQMGPAKGKVPVDMILNGYPEIKTLPKPMKTVVKPFLPAIMKEASTEKRYNVPAARIIKDSVNIPVIVVGGIHDLEDIEKTIIDDGFDFVSMSRALILEPGLINKYKQKKSREAKCLSCNYCLIGLYNEPLRCYYGKCKGIL